MSNLVTVKNGSRARTNSDSLTFPVWSSWIDEMFNRDLPLTFTSNFNRGSTLPRVNIRETKDAYFVEMAVPGLKKSDFRIDLDNQFLTIAAEWEEGTREEGVHFVRREFEYASFKRTFTLPETVKDDAIKAKYTNGIVSLHIPKREEAIQKPARRIPLS